MSHLFQKQIDSFSNLLDVADIDTSGYAVYCDNYLKHLMSNKNYYLNIYADVFSLLLKESGRTKENLTVVDFGAGNGMMGIFAKYCGFGKVIINDIDNDFLAAARTLSQNLNITIDKFVVGDIHQIILETASMKPDAIMATDVIEHIYDLNDFLTALRSINTQMITVFTTGSNPENYFKVKKLRKLQFKDEHEGSSPEDAELFGSRLHQSYFEIRKEIIKNYFQEAPETLVDTLAILTRGMQQKDIIIAIDNYRYSKVLPKKPADKYNTCHPHTGSWTERILTLEEYADLFHKAGFACKVHSGYYNSFNKGLKNILLRLVNLSIPTFGMKLAPFIFLSGKPVDK